MYEGGRVLNISSVGGYSAVPTLSFYNARKFGVSLFPFILCSQCTLVLIYNAKSSRGFYRIIHQRDAP